MIEFETLEELKQRITPALKTKAKELKEWLLSEEGQRFVEGCGYVPII